MNVRAAVNKKDGFCGHLFLLYGFARMQKTKTVLLHCKSFHDACMRIWNGLTRFVIGSRLIQEIKRSRSWTPGSGVAR